MTPESPSLDQSTLSERSYGVWRAFGETIIVEGREPVWCEPGLKAEWLGFVEAPDYETACFKWEESQNQAESLNLHDEHLCRDLGLDPAELPNQP